MAGGSGNIISNLQRGLSQAQNNMGQNTTRQHTGMPQNQNRFGNYGIPSQAQPVYGFNPYFSPYQGLMSQFQQAPMQYQQPQMQFMPPQPAQQQQGTQSGYTQGPSRFDPNLQYGQNNAVQKFWWNGEPVSNFSWYSMYGR